MEFLIFFILIILILIFDKLHKLYNFFVAKNKKTKSFEDEGLRRLLWKNEQLFHESPSGLSVELEAQIIENRRDYTIRNYKKNEVNIFYPLFSLPELEWQSLLYEEAKLKAAYYQGLTKSDDINKDSHRLARCVHIIARNRLKKNFIKMLEANFKIINGAKIDEVEKEFYDMHLEDGSVLEDDPEVQKLYNNFL